MEALGLSIFSDHVPKASALGYVVARLWRSKNKFAPPVFCLWLLHVVPPALWSIVHTHFTAARTFS
jgi:hypothetical protein